jgi:ATP adenylyltransferase
MDRLWAPWRARYVAGLADEGDRTDCFLCAAAAAPIEDAEEHFLLGRRKTALVMFNRFPYNTGHIMVAPFAHQGMIEAIREETVTEMWALLVLCKEILGEVLHPHGFNIGINQGRCSGAGVVDHLHIHIVPRWDGDTNFMPVIGETKVMSQSLKDLYAKLRPAFEAAGLGL